VLRVELQQVAVGHRGAGGIPGALHHHAQVEAVILVVRLALDRRHERALGLRVQPLLAIGHPQQRLGFDVVVVRQHGAGEKVDRLVQIALFKGFHALFPGGAHGHFVCVS
jgi:hypothetical protein